MKISEQILSFRGQKNLSQKEAAKLFGVSQATIYRAENGKSINAAKASRIIQIIESEGN